MSDTPTLTPPIPARFRQFRAQPHFTSIFEFYPNEPRLYGTEDWHGDWGARVLFMAKDAGSSRIFRPVSQGGRGWAWITDHSRPTNRNLRPLLDSIPGGKLYASFLGPLLRNDDQESGDLPTITPETEAFVCDLFRWTVERMPNLEIVAVLGREAWAAVTRAAGQPETFANWKHRHESGEPLTVRMGDRSVQLIALNHPARIPPATLIQQAGWRRIAGSGTHTPPPAGPRPRISAAKPRTQASPPTHDGWAILVPRAIERQRPVGIRAGMLDIIKRAGATGAPSRAFAHLDWIGGFRDDKLRTAMQFLSCEAGVGIEYKSSLAGGALEWRLAPART